MKRVLNLGNLSRIVEGDPNEITYNDFLVIKVNFIKGNILDIQKRVNGKLVSLITEKYTFTINPIPADATVVINGQTTKSIRVSKRQTVTWSVSKVGHYTKSGSDVIFNDVSKTVTIPIADV